MPALFSNMVYCFANLMHQPFNIKQNGAYFGGISFYMIWINTCI